MVNLTMTISQEVLDFIFIQMPFFWVINVQGNSWRLSDALSSSAILVYLCNGLFPVWVHALTEHMCLSLLIESFGKIIMNFDLKYNKFHRQKYIWKMLPA